MIYLHKILPLFFLPVGVASILVIAGLILRRRVLCWLGIGVLWIASLPVVAHNTMRMAEGWQARQSVAVMPSAAAIVVLSNGPVVPPGDATIVEWDDAVDRFEGGVALYQAGKAPVLILTGGWLPWMIGDKTAGDALAEIAVRRGIPREAVSVTGKAMNTAEEAQAVAKLLGERPQPFREAAVILVTSAFHMRRAQLLFERAGMTVIPFPVDFRAPEGRAFTILDLLPNADSLKQTEMALREFYGYLYYRYIR